MAKSNGISRVSSIAQQIKQLEAQRKFIEEANARFKKLSAADKRIEIARDVIAQIKSAKYKAAMGVYVATASPIYDDDLMHGYSNKGDETEREKQLCEVFQDMPKCTVCARGAMFVSACRMFNHFSVGEFADAGGTSDGADPDSFSDYEETFFTKKQVGMIESAFEKDTDFGYGREACSRKDSLAAVLFGKQYGKAEERLTAIMQNIIKNEGDFVVPANLVKKAEEMAKKLDAKEKAEEEEAERENAEAMTGLSGGDDDMGF